MRNRFGESWHLSSATESLCWTKVAGDFYQLVWLCLAKDNAIKTLDIVNVVGLSIAREADSVFYMLASPEISVVTTKG